MDHSAHNRLVAFLWSVADDVLRDVYVRGKYRDVILPMTVIRRLDALLEPTKEAVLKQKADLDAIGVQEQAGVLTSVAGQNFYNVSAFTLGKLLNAPGQLRANFTDYLDGFSTNVQEIVAKFDFRNHLRKLEESDVLGDLIVKFLDRNINLGPHPVLDGRGAIRLPGLTNHGMGYVFEKLIRRFNEENNEEAGEHFTPREIVRLMANLVLLPVRDRLESGAFLVYDCACGSGGMLTEAEGVLHELAREHDKEVSIHLYGQEVQAETYAICKADLLIKGEEERNVAFGSTLAADAFPHLEFDFMLANPPYGKSWVTDLERLGGKKEITDPRFVVTHDGDPEFSLVTRSSDGQLMFLVNMLSKMKREPPLGSHERWVEDVDQLRRWAGADRFVLAGGSYGTFISLEYALRHPEHLDAVILRGPSAEGPSTIQHGLEAALKAVRGDDERQTRMWMGQARDDEDLRLGFEKFAGVFAPPADKMLPIAERAAPPAHRFPPIFHAETHDWAFSRNLPAYDVRERLASIHVPTLVTVGRYDQVTVPAGAELIAQRIPGATLMVFEHSGHSVPADEPTRFQATLNGFLDPIYQRSRARTAP